MMDLAELRINRTPVTPNSKCEGCVHYDGNAAAKGGACEVGSAPALCGSGSEPKYGYAPLAELGPDEIDDLATPQINGQIGAMNEHGQIEQTVMMKRVCLGDEDLTIAQRIAGVVNNELSKSLGSSQGQVAAHCGVEMARLLYDRPLPLAYVVAKSLHDMYFAPRKQKKYGVVDVIDFLKSHGWDVENSYEVAQEAGAIAKSRFAPTRQIKVPTHNEAMEHIAQHNSQMSTGANPILPPSSRGSLGPTSHQQISHAALGKVRSAANRTMEPSHNAPSNAPGWKPRNRTPTAPMEVVKGDATTPTVKKAR